MTVSNKVRICVPLCERTFEALERATIAAAETADLVELRLDCLSEFDPRTGRHLVERLLEQSTSPIIVTLRPSEQGGFRDLTHEERVEFWKEVRAHSENVLFDIERDLCLKPMSLGPSVPWSQVICSYHNFDHKSESIDDLYEQLAATPARILKIAVRADDAVDCLPIFNLIERARREGREVIAIAMGNAGLATRVLGPSRGSFLTYAASGVREGTAPGQLTIDQLRSLYRIESIDLDTRIYGLVSSSVTYSVSTHIHNGAFAAKGLNAVYLPFEVHDLASFFQRMVHPKTREIDWPIGGLSITTPHKNAVLAQLDWVEPHAREVGAVNTVVVEGDELRGYNTDVHGFIQPLKKTMELGVNSSAAVIGAGGAANAVIAALKSCGVAVTGFARNLEKAESVAERFTVEYKALNRARFDGYDVVVNATPVGSRGELIDQTPATAEQLRGARLAYDLLYNPVETRFLREARSAGCRTIGGLEMLVTQATLQFKLWTGFEAPVDVMNDAAKRGLAR